ncbi:MAG: MerR family transcriptional regulator [Prevotellaceae bacterium]|jgi:DNA-binding transcriptional MerR regulator|nr:MerR family transcriptional regulator [Prevotellaceae bacterium]
MNEFKLKLTIGEFSKLCYVTVKTLRHYEQMELLVPHEVDEWTGYRYYDVSQMQTMIKIRNLKSLGLSLEEIKEVMTTGSEKPDAHLIARKIADATDELCRLRSRLQRLVQLQECTANICNMSDIVIKPLPGGVVASFRSHIKSYNELGNLCVSVIAPEMQRLGCECPPETAYCFTVDYNRNYTPNDIDLEYCEVVKEPRADSDLIKFRTLPIVEKAVCIQHKGNYDNFGATVAAAFEYLENNRLTLLSEPRFCYLHGIWDCDSEADWVTEIQIPVVGG